MGVCGRIALVERGLECGLFGFQCSCICFIVALLSLVVELVLSPVFWACPVHEAAHDLVPLVHVVWVKASVRCVAQEAIAAGEAAAACLESGYGVWQGVTHPVFASSSSGVNWRGLCSQLSDLSFASNMSVARQAGTCLQARLFGLSSCSTLVMVILRASADGRA